MMDFHVNSFVVALGHRYLASQLGFYLPDHPSVFRFETSGQMVSQYEGWDTPLKLWVKMQLSLVKVQNKFLLS